MKNPTDKTFIDSSVGSFISFSGSGSTGLRIVETSCLRIFKQDSGFTLIELIMVIVFLSVALVATMNMMSVGITDSIKIEVLTTATNLANRKLEQIYADKKSKGYAYLLPQNYPDETNADGKQGFNRYVTIIDQSTYKEVIVKVTHNDIEDCSLVAYLTNY
ncbi:MAG: prepilin-type N-terminal cleavage/methylation domain-containing protein [bacterium]